MLLVEVWKKKRFLVQKLDRMSSVTQFGCRGQSMKPQTQLLSLAASLHGDLHSGGPISQGLFLNFLFEQYSWGSALRAVPTLWSDLQRMNKNILKVCVEGYAPDTLPTLPLSDAPSWVPAQSSFKRISLYLQRKEMCGALLPNVNGDSVTTGATYLHGPLTGRASLSKTALSRLFPTTSFRKR